MRTVLSTALAIMVVGLWTACMVWLGVRGERYRMQRAWKQAADRIAAEARAARTPYKRAPRYPQPDESTRKAAQA